MPAAEAVVQMRWVVDETFARGGSIGRRKNGILGSQEWRGPLISNANTQPEAGRSLVPRHCCYTRRQI